MKIAHLNPITEILEQKSLLILCSCYFAFCFRSQSRQMTLCRAYDIFSRNLQGIQLLDYLYQYDRKAAPSSYERSFYYSSQNSDNEKVSQKSLGTLSSDDDDAGENVRKTIVKISKTLAVHVRYNLWYISLPSSAKQRREMTTIKVFWRTSTPGD